MYIQAYQNVSQVPNVIEMIGMPAVGKSTLCKEIISGNPAYIDANDLLPENHLVRQIYKAVSFLLCFFSRPAKSSRDLGILISTKQNRMFDFLKVVNDWFLICHMMDKANKDQKHTYIFDQGVYQQIWSVMFSGREQSRSLCLLQDTHCPSIVLYMDEDTDILRERESKRDRRVRLDYSNSEHIDRARDAFSLIVTYLSKNYELCEAEKMGLFRIREKILS